MTQPLEERYRRLLRGYPKAYREERSQEIIATLVQLARPGQRYPTIREAVALVLGGLRTRAGVHRRYRSGDVWAGTLHLAVLLLLADGAAMMLAESIIMTTRLIANGRLSVLSDLGFPLTTALVCGALLATAASRRAVALPLTLLAILTQYLWAPNRMTMNGLLWQLPLAAALTVPLLRWHAPASPHPVRWLVAVPVALIVMPSQLPAVFSEHSWTWILFRNQFWILQAALLGCALWSVVDARAALAAGAAMLAFALPALHLWATANLTASPTANTQEALYALVWGATAAIPLATGALRAARLARL
ncbi:MAG: hypothetical protein V7603_6044 [Micromonosporaceae bacterium]